MEKVIKLIDEEFDKFFIKYKEYNNLNLENGVSVSFLMERQFIERLIRFREELKKTVGNLVEDKLNIKYDSVDCIPHCG